MFDAQTDLSTIADAAMATISQPVYKYSEVKEAYNAARDAHGRRETFKTFLRITGLEEKIFLKGTSGGTRVMYKSDVHEAFEIFVDEKKAAIPQATYNPKASPMKKAKGLLLGYARTYGAKKGGSGPDRRKLKHPLVSAANWRAIVSGLKKEEDGAEKLESLTRALDSAGIEIPTQG